MKKCPRKRHTGRNPYGKAIRFVEAAPPGVALHSVFIFPPKDRRSCLLKVRLSFSLLWFCTLIPFLQAGSPWKVIENEVEALEAVLSFNKRGDFLFSLEKGCERKGVLSYVIDKSGWRDKNLRLEPVFRRGSYLRELTVCAAGGEVDHKTSVSFRRPPGYRAFAVVRRDGGGFVSLRKKILKLKGGREGVLLGGTPVLPDRIHRIGVSADTALGLFEDYGVQKEGLLLPAMCVSSGEGIVAWSGRGVGVRVVSGNRRPFKLSAAGRSPQIVSSGRLVYCVWSEGAKIFLAVSRDAGATWIRKGALDSSEDHSRLRLCARGRELFICWQTPGGISWLWSREGTKGGFSSGSLNGNYFRPSCTFTGGGAVCVSYLRRTETGPEAGYKVIDSPEGNSAKTVSLLSAFPVREVAAASLEGDLCFAFIVEVEGRRRLAQLTRGQFTYLLPEPGGVPLQVDLGAWGERICVSYACRSAGRMDLFSFTSSDGGFTWEGPLRLISGRSFCIMGGRLIVRWRGAGKGGCVVVNGEEVFSIPKGVSCGRGHITLDCAKVTPQGWIPDTAGYQGQGSVDVTAVLRIPGSEDVFLGKSQAHADKLSEGKCGPEPGPDCVLVSESLSKEKLRGSCGTELSVNLAVANLGSMRSGRSKISSLIGSRRLREREVPEIEPGEERGFALRIPLPETPGVYPLCFQLDTGKDRDLTNNGLEFQIEALGQECPTVQLGDRISINLSEQKRVRIRCGEEGFVDFDLSGLDSQDITAVLIYGDSTREVSCRRPVELSAGEYALVFRAGVTEGSVGLTLNRKTDRFEPNDSPELAYRVKPGVTLPIRLTPQGDKDWFAITVSDQGHLSLSAADVPKDCQPVVSLRAKGSQWLLHEGGLPFSACLDPGVYELLVLEKWAEKVESLIRLEVDFAGKSDKNEPNDRPEDAKPLALTGVASLRLYPPGDRDWFSFQAPERGYLMLRLRRGAGVPLEAGLFEGTAGGIPVRRKLPCAFRVGKGRQLLRFSCKSLLKRTIPLVARFKPEFDPLEPNDTVSRATEITLPGEAEMALWPAGDRDWFTFKTDRRGYLKIELPAGPSEGTRAGVSLRSGGTFQFTQRPVPSVFHVASGRSFVEFQSLGRNVSDRLFKVAFSFAPELDKTEGNNSAETAAQLQCPGRREFAIWPYDDVDFFRLDLDSDGLLELEVSGKQLEGKLEFFFPGGTSSGKVISGRKARVKVEKGKLLVRVRALWKLKKPLRLVIRSHLEKEREDEGRAGTRRGEGKA